MLKKSGLTLIAAIVMYVLAYQNQTLREDLAVANSIASARQHRIDDLIEKTNIAKDEQRKLSDQLATNRAALARRDKQLENLLNENAELKAWADRPLPAGLDWLQRDTITGHTAYRQHLSDRQPLPAESDNPDEPP